MSTFGYRRELSKYEDLDEDELLSSLTAEELLELEKELVDIDPDGNVPIGLRQRDQTAKTPTGTFSRDALLKYWENETRKLLDNERMGSSSPQGDNTEKDECLTESNSEESEDEKEANEENEKGECKDHESEYKEERELETSVTEEEDEEEDEEEEDETENEEEECNYKKQTFPDKCPPPHYLHNGYTALQPEELNPSFRAQESFQLSGNPTLVDEALEKILNNDLATIEVNLNNIDNLSQETLIRFAEALHSNTHVRIFSLANTHADDHVAFAIAKMLRENCHITNVNIESNFITGKGILALVQALTRNSTLTELRFHNQRHILGGQVEMEIVKLLKENNTLLKLGYQFDLPGPRMCMTSILTCNQDRQRQRRMQEQRHQQGGAATPMNSRTHVLQRSTPNSSPYGSPRGSPWSSPKLLHNDLLKRNDPPAPSPPLPPPPAPPPPPPTTKVQKSVTEKKAPTRKIAEVIKLHQVSSRELQPQTQGKSKTKKGKKMPLKEKETASRLKDLKNALRPVADQESSRPSTPQRSAHDELMASIRSSSIKTLRQVTRPKYLQ